MDLVQIVEKLVALTPAAIYLGAVIILWRQLLAVQAKYEALLAEMTKAMQEVADKLGEKGE